MIRTSALWRRLEMIVFERAQLGVTQKEFSAAFAKRRKLAIRAAPSRISGKTGT